MNNNVKRKVRDFFNSLTEEKENFNLPLAALLKYKLLITKEKEGKIIGIAGIQGDRGRNMFFVVVKSEYQDKKIGQELTKKVIREAIKRNYSYISLSVFESNAKAVRIFRMLGFRVLYTYLMKGRGMYSMILPLNRRGIILGKVFLLKHTIRSFFCGDIVRFRLSHARF